MYRQQWRPSPLCSLCAVFANAQQTTDAVVEVTKSDFTQQPNITSMQLSFFGIRVGQTEQEAGKAFRANAPTLQLTMVVNPETSVDTGCLLLVEKKRGDYFAEIYVSKGRVYKIAWFPGVEWYLVGDSRSLLSAATGELDSNLRLKLLGREDEVLREKFDTIYAYKKKGIRLVSATRTAWTSSVELVLPSH